MAKTVLLLLFGVMFMISVTAGFLSGKSALSVMTFSLIIYAVGAVFYVAASKIEKKNQ